MFVRRKSRLLSVALVCMCLLCSCGSTDSPKVSDISTPAALEETPLPTPQMETITVFTIDSASMTILPSKVKKNQDDDSLSYIAELVLNNLGDDDIRLSKVEQDGDRAVLEFDSESKPVKDCDEEMESLILECFANSILDNVEGCHSVIFRTDKGAYESDNLKMGIDEAYASR